MFNGDNMNRILVRRDNKDIGLISGERICIKIIDTMLKDKKILSIVNEDNFSIDVYYNEKNININILDIVKDLSPHGVIIIDIYEDSFKVYRKI